MIIENHSVYIRAGFRPKKDWAVFLDRDGVINVEKNLAYRIKDCELIPATVLAIKILNTHDIPVIVVHNAAAVARNLCSPKQVEKFNHYLIRQLLLQGAVVDALFYCPHHSQAFNPQFKKDCSWRKPKAGMLLAAQAQFKLNLTKSYLIGDNQRDMEAAKAAGVMPYLIHSGQSAETIIKKIL